MVLGQWWNDYWQLVAGIAAGAVVTVLIALWQRQPKRIDYLIISSVRLLSRQAESFAGALRVLVGDVVIDDPRLITIRIVNSGKRAVVGAEFVEPITVRYHEAHPVTVQPAAVSHKSLNDSIDLLMAKQGDRDIVVTVPLLNAREWFDLQILSDGDPGAITITSRFVDQSRPMRRLALDQVTVRGRFERVFGSLAAIAMLSLVAAVLFAGLPSPWDALLAVTTAAVAFVVIDKIDRGSKMRRLPKF